LAQPEQGVRTCKARTLFAAVLLASALSGCGGSGGGSAQPAASGSTFPVAAAVSALQQMIRTYTLTSGSGVNTYVAQYSFEPGPVTTFEEHIASTTNVTFSATQNGNVPKYFSLIAYFQDNPYLGWGGVANNGQYVVDSSQQLLPASAAIGQSGPVDTVTTYADSSKQSVVLVTTQTWSLAANEASTAWWCINSAFAPTTGPASAPESECYAMDTSGNITGMMLTTTVNGQSLTFR
jgi:hypothetical protein